MNRADETAAKIETAERQSVGAAAGSDDKLAKQLEDFPGASPQSRPALHNLLLRITHHLDYEHSERNVFDYRLRAIESQMKAIGSQTKRRASRAFVRYPVAICVGVAGTLAWQSYGEEAKQTIATRAPELGWSPEVRQMIASWTKPLAGPENTAARPAASERPASGTRCEHCARDGRAERASRPLLRPGAGEADGAEPRRAAASR